MVLTYIGYSHRKKGDTDVGIGFYKQALAIDPNNLNTHEYPRRRLCQRRGGSSLPRPNWPSSRSSVAAPSASSMRFRPRPSPASPWNSIPLSAVNREPAALDQAPPAAGHHFVTGQPTLRIDGLTVGGTA